ncbi:hypothetical protein [Kineosporia succinea]|uniref:Uncharacterized protein n=1 Tax=Kineosporia succinea TaxID=84632 RepID=A0ABT9PB28_9ACTN|nr:hypothetical protein [Kineosporia succinea]MDP9829903.1 hypothetical protein [Kineosporia succinea]
MPRRQKRILVGVLGGLLVLALAAVAGVVVLAGSGESADEKRERYAAPFVEAANALKEAPGLRFDDGTYDVQLTSFGDYTGTARIHSAVAPIMRTDGSLYAQLGASAVRTLLPYVSGGGARSWVSMSPGDLDTLSVDGSVPESPEAAGEAVLDAINASTSDFTPPTDGTTAAGQPNSGTGNTAVTLNGTPALMAETPAGAIYVTAASPHTLLHVPDAVFTGETGDGADAPQNPQNPQGPQNPGGSTDEVSFTRPVADRDPGPATTTFDGVTLTPLDAAQVSKVYDELAQQAGTLDDVLDAGVDLALGVPTVDCTLEKCSYKVKVTTYATAGGDDAAATSRIALTASFEVDGKKGVGACTTALTFRSDQARTIGCTTRSAAGEMKDAMADARADALVRSRALGGARVQYSVPYYGEGLVRGVAQIDVKKLVATLQDRAGR